MKARAIRNSFEGVTVDMDALWGCTNALTQRVYALEQAQASLVPSCGPEVSNADEAAIHEAVDTRREQDLAQTVCARLSALEDMHPDIPHADAAQTEGVPDSPVDRIRALEGALSESLLARTAERDALQRDLAQSQTKVARLREHNVAFANDLQKGTRELDEERSRKILMAMKITELEAENGCLREKMATLPLQSDSGANSPPATPWYDPEQGDEPCPPTKLT